MTQQEQIAPHGAGSESRHATWLELFFDLIFVVAIAKAAHVLQHAHNGHIEAGTYAKYILIMIPVWWAWVGATLFATRFDCDDTGHRLMSLIQMFCIIVLAANINTDFDSYYKGFLFSYVAIRFMTVAMYLRASFQNPETRDVSNFLAFAFSVGTLISLSSLFLEGIPRYAVLYAGIGLDMIGPLVARKRLQTAPVNAHHLPERVGLLTIILLGESVLSLTNGVDALSWALEPAAMAVCGFVLACGLWWLYFDNLQRRIVGHQLGHGQGIIYLHLIIYTGLGGIAAMIRFAISPELSLIDYKLLSAFGILSVIITVQLLHVIYRPGTVLMPLLRNAVLFDILFIALLVLAPSITVVMAGTALLMSVYAIIDRLSNSHAA